MKNYQNLPLLTREEEYELGYTIQRGLKAKERLESEEELSEEETAKLKREKRDYIVARATMCERNIRLVESCANMHVNYGQNGLDFEDYVQEGIPGLMTAIDKYDPSRGNKFSTVAWQWIHQSITRGSNKVNRLVRLPENRISEYMRMKAISSEMDKPLESEDVMERIESEMGISRPDIKAILNAASGSLSLNKTIGNDSEGEKTLMELLEDEKSDSADTFILEKENATKIISIMNSLKPEERDALKAEFGFPSSLYDVNKSKASRGKKVREYYGITLNQHRANLSSAISTLKEKVSQTDMNYSDFD